MQENTPDSADGSDTDLVHEIVARSPSGAFVISGIATAIVVLLYVAFYFFVYLPRGAVQ